MRATFLYTAARFLMFIIAGAVAYLVGARGFLLLALAVVISGVVSFLMLSRQRDAMSGALTARLSSFRRRLDEGTRAEDDD